MPMSRSVWSSMPRSSSMARRLSCARRHLDQHAIRTAFSEMRQDSIEVSLEVLLEAACKGRRLGRPFGGKRGNGVRAVPHRPAARCAAMHLRRHQIEGRLRAQRRRRLPARLRRGGHGYRIHRLGVSGAPGQNLRNRPGQHRKQQAWKRVSGATAERRGLGRQAMTMRPAQAAQASRPVPVRAWAVRHGLRAGRGPVAAPAGARAGSVRTGGDRCFAYVIEISQVWTRERT